MEVQKEVGRVLIIAGGVCEERALIAEAAAAADTVICADKGLDYALDAGITPDILIGDFDSLSGDIPKYVECVKLPCEKDDTDLGAAVRLAESRNASSVRIICAFGGRPDHELAAIQTVLGSAVRGFDTSITGKRAEVYAVVGERTFKKEKHRYISVFCLGETASGISIEGAKYPLHDAELNSYFPLGVSNEFVDPEVRISVKKGALAVMLING